MRAKQALGIVALIAMAFSVPALLQAVGRPDEPGPSANVIQQLEDRVAALESLLQFVTIDFGTINGLTGPHVIFEAVNVHIRNDSGTTAGTPDGLGNLIIGYNEDVGSDAIRAGSHNVVVGREHSYSSFGGFVAGFGNTISGPNSSVSGGSVNEASGIASSVSGGQNNTATTGTASVSGGNGNTASGLASSVSGGFSNTASGVRSSVSGGRGNTASGARSSVSGGLNRSALGDEDWAAGGLSQPN